MQWKTPEEPRHKKSKNVSLAAKGNGDSSFFYIHGVVMMEWVPYHCKVNADFYVKTLRKLREHIRKKRPELWDTKSFVVHYDNAPSHRAQLVEKFLKKKNDMFVIPRAPYSPDLVPCNFFLFQKLKLVLKGQHLGDLDGMKQIGGVLADTNFRRLPKVF